MSSWQCSACLHGRRRLHLPADAGRRALPAGVQRAQDIKLSYNEQGQLVDRGEFAQAQEILALFQKDWGYPVVAGDLNPNDPLVNTPTE